MERVYAIHDVKNDRYLGDIVRPLFRKPITFWVIHKQDAIVYETLQDICDVCQELELIDFDRYFITEIQFEPKGA